MLADIGLGIFVALIAAKLFGLEISNQLVGMSILFALLPDADFVVSIITHNKIGGKYAHTHRDLFHFPLPYIAVGSAVAALFGPLWLFIFTTASLAHFIHDSMGIGWGIKWMYPFSKKISKLFSTPKGELSMRGAAIWTEEELEKVAKEKGNEYWIRDIYFRWHPIGVAESVVFIAAVISLWLATRQ